MCLLGRDPDRRPGLEPVADARAVRSAGRGAVQPDFCFASCSREGTCSRAGHAVGPVDPSILPQNGRSAYLIILPRA